MASEYREKQSLVQRIFSYQVFAPLIIASIIIGLDQFPLFHQLENLTIDHRVYERSKNQQPPDPRLLFVGIDDTSLGDFESSWPMNRQYYGEFVKNVSNGKPALYAWDILFDRSTENDPYFVEGISSTGIPMIFAAAMSGKDENYPIPPGFSTGWKASPEVMATAKNKPESLILPIPTIREIVKLGSVDVPKDAYGVVRKVPMYILVNDQILPSITLQILMTYWKLTPENVRIIPGDAIYLESSVIKRTIPIDAHGNFLVNFRYDIVRDKGSPVYEEKSEGKKTFFTASFSKLLRNYFKRFTENDTSESLYDVRDKIIFLGVTATAGTDIGPSPFQAESPRPFIHVNILDNILKEDYLIEIKPVYAWTCFIVIAYLSLFLLNKKNFWISALIPLAILGIFIIIAFTLFSSQNILIPLVGPCLAFFLLHVGSVGKQVLEERAARDHLRRTFSTYVSSGILDAIYKNPDALQLGGGYKDVTILFSDIRSFTTMTESMDSVALVQQLNEYFTEMVGCINKYNGTLHKFIGDAIMAVWGDVAYAGSTVDAGQALRAAIDMREALKVLNARWRSEGRPEFHMGVGINHGKVVVGNIGAPQRMEFTVIGDSVNLASRLEGLTKKFGTEIMVGESVYDLTHERFAFRSLAKVQVVGKTQPTKIFEPLYELGQESLSPYSPEWVRLFEEAYARFTERRYDVAIRLFEACLNEHPENTTTLMLLEMSRNFAQQPPPEDWNGAFEFTSK